MKVGYARVSTKDQSLDAQIKALKAAGCEEIFSEKASAVSRKNPRTELNNALTFVRKGDILVVTRIDRIARSVEDFKNILTKLKEKSVEFQAIEQPIETQSTVGKLMLNVLSSIAEFEADLRRDRQLEGIALAKERGAFKGTQKSIDREQVWQMLDSGLSMSKVSQKLGIGVGSVHRIAKEREKQDGTSLNNQP